jgi:hypothetical protein
VCPPATSDPFQISGLLCQTRKTSTLARRGFLSFGSAFGWLWTQYSVLSTQSVRSRQLAVGTRLGSFTFIFSFQVSSFNFISTMKSIEFLAILKKMSKVKIKISEVPIIIYQNKLTRKTPDKGKTLKIEVFLLPIRIWWKTNSRTPFYEKKLLFVSRLKRNISGWLSDIY